jgi:hypothetical protein
MRHYKAILQDIEKYMSSHGLKEDLESLQAIVNSGIVEYELCSQAGTWLATFMMYCGFDEPVQDLIGEFFDYCELNKIRFV